MVKRTAVACLLFLMIIVAPAGASDHTNLEEGLPVQMVDAYPTAYLNREIQGVFRYERTDGGESRFFIQPRLEYGFARNWQGSIDVPVYAGNADRTGSGNIGLEALYNFNNESKFIPAFALAGRLELPTGQGNDGLDTAVRIIASKMLVPGTLLHRVHLNAVWHRNSGASGDEREHRYAVIAGFDIRAGKDAMLVADFVREQERKKDEAANIIEAGIRRQITPFTVLSLGAGFGVSDQSPDYRVMAGFQHSF